MLRYGETTTYSSFCRDADGHLTRLKGSQRPTYILRRGKAEAVVLTAKQFEAYAADREYMETVRAIEESRKQLAAGLGRPWTEVKKELRKKFSAAKRRAVLKRKKTAE
jgi:PHD/YefM family antitoxin component YafN of YafNO toxin-antitoxin module